MNNVYFVILGGGQGERLWPISRIERPKQFVPFLDNKSLIEQTIDRIKKLEANTSQIGIVTNKIYRSRLLDLVGKDVGFILQEDESRNTAAAMLYAALDIYKKNPESIIVFLPADSFVIETEKYIESLSVAIEYAKGNKKIVTMGVMPSGPNISYGYIQAQHQKNKHINVNTVYEVEKFHEKPDLKKAQEYLLHDAMLWNISVFATQTAFFLSEFKMHALDIYNQMQDFIQNKALFSQINNISIDYALMEKSKNISVVPCDFAWYDVGNIDVFLNLQNKLSKEHVKIINIDGQNNLATLIPKKINHERLVAFVGVSDLCVVEDEDVLLIVKKSDVEKVKDLLVAVKKSGGQEYL
ncbi:MAG: Mannose-1-phosphate guanylyltransferase/mannose-6-phosphate isomerase [candidate division TM6 bacterium GW2011_GWF2_28_16]|nr:MAG: Mannose-1-phosphate guanylyltransferase/mannose-6-phosphate isomerase [candidate division TM6 bacterium GW2011_GWF2_28_16]